MTPEPDASTEPHVVWRRVARAARRAEKATRDLGAVMADQNDRESP